MKPKLFKPLILHLKSKWFYMIQAGIKKEEYREINSYWISRLIKPGEKKGFRQLGTECFKEFPEVHFYLGYPKKTEKNKICIKKPYYEKPFVNIRIDNGVKDWGAEPGKKYFVISWGAPHTPVGAVQIKDETIFDVKL